MPALSLQGCIERRNRLLELLSQEQIDSAVISDPRDCYYFTGALLPDDLPSLLLISADGTTLLVCPEGYEAHGLNRVSWYEWNHRGTRHPDPLERVAIVLARVLPVLGSKRVAIQPQLFPMRLAEVFERAGANEFSAIDKALSTLQRRKDEDEVNLIREAIRANVAAYTAVAQTIAPGKNELDVLSAGRQGATRAAGEKVFHDGDYQSGAYNGPARNRAIERGELYIIDAWTCYRGYWADMSRTFIVGAEPTEVQQALFEHIRWVQSQVPALLKPDVDGKDVYQALDELIRQHQPLADKGLIHHGGHAIGLRSHEMPDINLQRGGKLEAGNVICVEPGGYFQAANFGVRLENMYLITETGCTDLCPGNVELLRCG